jgi:dipeptide transport system permease protein
VDIDRRLFQCLRANWDKPAPPYRATIMIRFILTRLGLVIPTFIGITFLAFFLIRLVPGDPIETLAGERGIDPVRHEMLRKEYGFDQPVLVQYAHYIGRLLQGDLGRSVITHEPVMAEFRALFPATIELALCAVLFALILGLPAGMLAAVRRNSIFDHGVMSVSLAGYSMPIFWWGLLLILLFSVTLDLTPVSGRLSNLYYVEPATGFLLIDSLMSDQEGAFRSTLAHLILPTVVLGTVPLAVIARMTRSAMLEVLGEDYIRTARAKGLPVIRVIGLHALRNALIPVVTVIGLQVAGLFTGAILTETIFSWPGVGKWLVEAIYRRDYPVLQGGTLLLGTVVMAVNLIVDVLYGLINPRIRHTR